jgi:hypothetical protein
LTLKRWSLKIFKFLNDLFPCIFIAQGLEESEGRITALISKVRTLENVNTDLNKKITGLDRRGKEQEALHKKQVKSLL